MNTVSIASCPEQGLFNTEDNTNGHACAHHGTFITAYTSCTVMEAIIVKLRLESEGIPCFLRDEYLIGVQPFWSVSLGGVRLQIHYADAFRARAVLDATAKGLLVCGPESYPIGQEMESEAEKESQKLSFRAEYRLNPENVPSNPGDYPLLTAGDIDELISSERDRSEIKKRKPDLSWKQFFYELFDPGRDFFRYLRPVPTETFILDHLIDKSIEFSDQTEEIQGLCPVCGSCEVRQGFVTAGGWNIIYLIVSILFFAPFPPFVRKFHCFSCGAETSRLKPAYHDNIMKAETP